MLTGVQVVQAGAGGLQLGDPVPEPQAIFTQFVMAGGGQVGRRVGDGRWMTLDDMAIAAVLGTTRECVTRSRGVRRLDGWTTTGLML
jgi:hypothetical protein